MNSYNNIKDSIIPVIQKFDSIDLSDLDKVSLLNRVDSKFIFNLEQLPTILSQLQQYYNILDIKGVRINQYDSIYFDTPDLKLYNLHHNDRKNRFKIRYRKYVDSDLSFFELKMKNNKGRTIKHRFKTPDIYDHFTEPAKELLANYLSERANWPFVRILDILFKRLTFSDKNFSERATIDIDLRFKRTDGQVFEVPVGIVELKQEKQDRKSPMFGVLKNNGIYPYKVSKYCTGILKCYPDVKYNRFKKKMLKIDQLLYRNSE